MTVLESLADGRADLEGRGLGPPYIAHLPPNRGARLLAELAEIGVPLGIPLGGFVPDPKDDEGWTYQGVVLGDIHVFVRGLPTR